jgi:hypothetical protein
MSGIDTLLVAYGTSRVRSTFVHPTGPNEIITMGTGFWVAFQSWNPIFITNKHNFDLKMTHGEDCVLVLEKVEIELRKRDATGQWLPETKFFSIAQPIETIVSSCNADCSIVPNPAWEERDSDFWWGVVTQKPEEIADQNFMISKIAMMDRLSFVGFPGNSRSQWWDTRSNLPIARSATISSIPHIPFENPNIKVKDVTLVDGFSLQKGIPLAGGGDHPAFAMPKIVGIMSGHFNDEDRIPDILQKNPGLSYYTRATSIIDLFISAKICPFSK